MTDALDKQNTAEGGSDAPNCCASLQLPSKLLKNLGAKLGQMMAEDWRGEEERNTLGMAGHWLEKMADDAPKRCDQCGRDLLPDLEESRCVVCSESCQCVDRASVYRDGVPWCINCSAQIIQHNDKTQQPT